jgi:pyruvate/2-oxoglutarate dehydrogenase complex dihydrolipoamide dehydrogenase (E3) component
MERVTTDICIIGAGSGGLSLAAGAAQMGARVVLVEGGEMGGDCLNTGCVPSKALLAAAKHAHAMTTGAAFGIAPAPPQIDFAAVKDHVARTIAAIAPHDSQERFEGFGIRVIRAWGRFTSPRELEAGGVVVRARRFVIATGSRAAIPPVPGLESVPFMTNETIFNLREKPDHLVILGGGPIGMEMAQAHRRLGCDVTVIEAFKALGRDDPEAAAAVIDALRREGITLHEGQSVVRVRAVEAVEGVEGAGVELVLSDGRTLTGSHLLVAAGRDVALDRLNLDAAGVAHSKKGVTVGPGLRSTTNRRVYALGDAAGGMQFTHVAGYHAGVVIRQVLFGLPAKATTHQIPRVTYTDPELAQIGLTEAEARTAHGDRLTVLRQPFSGNDRAQAEGMTEGFLKLMVVKNRPVGVTLVGPQAGDLVGLWALAISSRLKIGAVAGMVLPYPTRGEIAKRVAGAYFSPKLFDNPAVKRVVGLVQRLLP